MFPQPPRRVQRPGLMGLESEHHSWGPWNTVMETESEQNSTSTNGSSSSGGSSRPQIAQMSLYERQAVQALQALQRQPNAAQYFHQFMLQQQLSNAQLHSLAAVQQATIAASRQASSPNSSTAQQQTATTQASINLATTSAAQLISRSQSVSSPSATTLTQSVLLGNATSPLLNQSQAQMYLRPQLGNLLQVNRTLGRNVPLASQLILMPNGAVAAVQQEVPPAQSPGVHADADQVQNLAVRNQQASAQGPQMPGSTQKAIPPGASPVSGLSQASSQALAVAQASSGASGQSLNLSQAGGGSGNSLPGSMGPGGGGQAPGGLGQLSSSGLGVGSCPRKGTGVVQPLPPAQTVTVSQDSQTEAESAAAKKAEAEGSGQQNVGMNLTRTATPAPSQTLISSATYTQIQPHSLIQQQQQIHLQQKQVVIQQQIAIHHQQQFPHRQSQLLHTATHLQLAQQQQQQQQQQQTTMLDWTPVQFIFGEKASRCVFSVLILPFFCVVCHTCLPVQAQIGHQAYYQQVSYLAFNDLKVCTAWDPSAYFHNLIQQPGQRFTNFFVHLNKAGEWRVGPGPTREMLIKQLVWEVLNTPTCSVVITVCNEDIHKWELVIRDLDPSNGPVNALTSPWMSSWQMCSMLTIYTGAPK
ncbi:polyhomeotic-like protein 1 [Microtus ochrogaster]|uniref:Polyhomeotic-like protein 1 n=1 Tax=Microtus ochrogaster TaxID=79684 RepID=A0ABM1USB4_MICOH|nr:polyhomeotic-like protein 1 [Microtus ochrogaster]